MLQYEVRAKYGKNGKVSYQPFFFDQNAKILEALLSAADAKHVRDVLDALRSVYNGTVSAITLDVNGYLVEAKNGDTTMDVSELADGTARISYVAPAEEVEDDYHGPEAIETDISTLLETIGGWISTVAAVEKHNEELQAKSFYVWLSVGKLFHSDNYASCYESFIKFLLGDGYKLCGLERIERSDDHDETWQTEYVVFGGGGIFAKDFKEKERRSMRPQFLHQFSIQKRRFVTEEEIAKWSQPYGSSWRAEEDERYVYAQRHGGSGELHPYVFKLSREPLMSTFESASNRDYTQWLAQKKRDCIIFAKKVSPELR